MLKDTDKWLDEAKKEAPFVYNKYEHVLFEFNKKLEMDVKNVKRWKKKRTNV
jgi:hypothetical protein